MNKQIIYFSKIIKYVLHPQGNCLELSEDVEWSRLIQIAKSHNILPLFVEGVAQSLWYNDITNKDELLKESFSIVAKQTQRTQAFLKLYRSFAEAGIYPLVLKGLVCRCLYGEMCEHRPSGDEDILIHPSEYAKAKAVLLENGYISDNDDKTQEQLTNIQEISFFHPIEKLHIELHLNVMGRENDSRVKMSDYFQNVFNDYREIEVGKVQLRTLSHQNHFLYLILHAFKHFIGGGFGIRQMLDILLYQEQYGQEIDMRQIHQILQGFRAEKFWGDLVDIGNCYFGFDIEPLSSVKCPDALLQDMISCGTFGNETHAQRAASRAITFTTGDYLKKKKKNKISVLWSAIFPNRVYLMNSAPRLETQPWLLPLEWIKRWGRYLTRSFHHNGNLTSESLEIMNQRIDLLKKYDLI